MSSIRDRLETPIERVVDLRDRALEAFPLRVWRGFLRGNGFLLSAGMGYYVLFALFALLYVAFAATGIWLGASDEAIAGLVALVNIYIPGLIGPGGLFTVPQVTEIAQEATGVLSVTGLIALAVAIWTAIGAVTFTRRAVRDLFGLPFDARNYLLLKARDLLAAVLFGGALLAGAVLSWLGVWALGQVFHLAGWSTASWIWSFAVRAVSIIVALALDAAALALLVRFLTGVSVRWRVIWPGSMVGAAAMVVLQLALGLVLAHAPTNPLLASFAVMVALLLWCRWMAIVMLVAASIISVTAEDRDGAIDDATLVGASS